MKNKTVDFMNNLILRYYSGSFSPLIGASP